MESIEAKDKKCPTCKCYKYPSQYFNSTGRLLKTCGDCRAKDAANREKNKCDHGRQKSKCKDCGGGAICTHGKVRSRCVDCKGGQICEHSRLRTFCRDCGGNSFCIHNIIRSKCKECGGGSVCDHERLRSSCKECDKNGHLSGIVRSQVHKAIKHDKEFSSKEYIGCDIVFYRQYIEKQFKEGMTWENYGEWHIDHIIPLKYESPTLEEVIKRLHHTNTQPLWADENMAKGNRFIG